MNRILQWTGSGPLATVEPPAIPGAGEVLLHATHTLLEFHPEPHALPSIARVRERGSDVDLQPGARVAVQEPTPRNALTVAAKSCIAIEASADAAAAAVVAVLAEVLLALRRIECDLGTNAIVTGSDLRAELLLLVLSAAGMRSVLAIREADAPEPIAAVANLLRGSPSEYREALAAHLQGLRGPVRAFDTTAKNGVIESLLAAVPSASSVALLGRRNSTPTNVNFYRDVHRKNVRLIGSGPSSVSGEDSGRAHRLLAEGRIAVDRFQFESVVASDYSMANPPGRRWVLLQWDTNPFEPAPNPNGS